MDRQFKPTFCYFGKPFFVLMLIDLLVCLILTAGGFWGAVLSFSSIYSWSCFFALLGLAVASVVAFGRFAMPLYYWRKVQLHVYELRGGHAYVYHGGPGVGKTLSMTYDGVILAEWAEDDLRFRELKYRSAEASGEHFATLEDWYMRVIVRETLEAIERLPECIPFLMSNYGIELEDGRRSIELTADYITQVKRAPENAVMLYTEAADDFDNRRVNAKADSETAKENTVVNETFSKIRHYYDAYVILDEQDAQEIYIGLRRVVYRNRYLMSMEHVCQPLALQKRYDKLANKVKSRGFCSYRELQKLRALDAKIKKIGFFKLYYRDDGNTQQGEKDIERGWYVLPHNLSFRYEPRAFVFDNAALSQKIDINVCESLYRARKPGA